MTTELSYAARFFMMALQIAHPAACVHLADPQMNLWLKDAFKDEGNCRKYLGEFADYALKRGAEPNWHKQAREIIEGRWR